MSATAEILRTLDRLKGKQTALAIWEGGSFDCEQPTVMAALSVMAKDDGPLIRSKPAEGGRFTYEIRPGTKIPIAEIEIPTLGGGGAKPSTPARPANGERKESAPVAADPYAAVLADLKAKRADIDNAIACIEKLRG